jgi:hypothetical protein
MTVTESLRMCDYIFVSNIFKKPIYACEIFSSRGSDHEECYVLEFTGIQRNILLQYFGFKGEVNIKICFKRSYVRADF